MNIATILDRHGTDGRVSMSADQLKLYIDAAVREGEQRTLRRMAARHPNNRDGKLKVYTVLQA